MIQFIDYYNDLRGKYLDVLLTTPIPTTSSKADYTTLIIVGAIAVGAFLIYSKVKE